MKGVVENVEDFFVAVYVVVANCLNNIFFFTTNLIKYIFYLNKYIDLLY